MKIPDFEVTSFPGLNTAVKDTKTLKPGIAVSSLNWLSGKYGDHIELRRGQQLLHATRESGAGKITGLGVGRRADGTEIVRWARGQKVEYLDPATEDRAETGTNILGTAADGEDVWFAPYQNLAGSFSYFGSPNSGVWKSPEANPGSAVSQAVNNFRWGSFRFGRGRSNAGQRNGTTAGNRDHTGAYLSHIDKALLSSFTNHTGEAHGTGDEVTTTFAGTLTNVTGVKTAMYVSVTDSTETFTDDGNGTMVGSLGGTGTINYATGAVSVTFNTAPTNLQAITRSYYVEDSTSQGSSSGEHRLVGAGPLIESSTLVLDQRE